MQINHPIVNYSSKDSRMTQKLTSTSTDALKKTPQKDQNQSPYTYLLEFGAMSLLGGLAIKILASQNMTQPKDVSEEFSMNHKFTLSNLFKFEFYKLEVCPNISGAIKKVAESLKVCSSRCFSFGNREITIKNFSLSSTGASLAANELPSLFTNAATVFAEVSNCPIFSTINKSTWPLVWRNNSLNLKLQKGAKFYPETISLAKTPREVENSNHYLSYAAVGLLLVPLAAYGTKRVAQPAINRLIWCMRYFFLGGIF